MADGLWFGRRGHWRSAQDELLSEVFVEACRTQHRSSSGISRVVLAPNGIPHPLRRTCCIQGGGGGGAWGRCSLVDGLCSVHSLCSGLLCRLFVCLCSLTPHPIHSLVGLYPFPLVRGAIGSRPVHHLPRPNPRCSRGGFRCPSGSKHAAACRPRCWPISRLSLGDCLKACLDSPRRLRVLVAVGDCRSPSGLLTAARGFTTTSTINRRLPPRPASTAISLGYPASAPAPAMETSAWIALVLGIIGLIFFTVMLLPQIYQNWAHKSTGTLSYTTMLLWTLFCVFLAVSLVDSGQTISLIVQANVLGFLTVICLVQIRFYNSPRLAKHPRLLMLLAWESLWVSVVLGGLEYLLVYLCQVARSNGREWLGPAMNVLGNVCVALGYIPQYREIFLAKSCFGVSRLFLMCDILGGLFSIASLAFIAPFDYLAAACYGTIALLTASIFALGCHYGYNPPQNTEQASA